MHLKLSSVGRQVSLSEDVPPLDWLRQLWSLRYCQSHGGVIQACSSQKHRDNCDEISQGKALLGKCLNENYDYLNFELHWSFSFLK